MKLNILAMYHPAAALHRPRLWAIMLDDWEHFPTVVPHDFYVKSDRLSYPSEVSLDTENDGLGKLGAWSVGYRDEEGHLCVEPHFGADAGKNFNQPVIMHNAKWDLRVMREAGMQEPPQVHDTMIAAYCLPPSTKILYRDLIWREIGGVKVGDELVGVDEFCPENLNKRSGRRRMRISTVTGVAYRKAPCIKITMNDGRSVISTYEHPWLCQRPGLHKGMWRRTDQLRVNWAFPMSFIPWEVGTSYEDGYIGGLFDGEGWVNKTYASVGVAQNKGLVLEKLKELLNKKGIHWIIHDDDGCQHIEVTGRRDSFLVLGSTRPVRLLDKEYWIGHTPTSAYSPVVRIVDLTPVEEQEVVSIETTTHTFNAEGFWTHNCMGFGRASPKDPSNSKAGDRMVGGLGLKYLARRHLGMNMRTWEEVKDHPELIPEYNYNDSVATLLLWEQWKSQLPKHYWTIDMPLLNVIRAMEDRGVAIDTAYLGAFSLELQERADNLRAKIPLNPNATQELQSYVYGALGVEPWKFTQGGAPSVDEDVLESIDDPIIKLILEYKDVSKELETYAENYVNGLRAGRIHCEFKQTSTTTGRLSAANPNLQNVPREGNMRRLFVAPEGKYLVVMDYRQLEFMMLVAITQDAGLLKLINEGYDFHTASAMLMGMTRQEIKPINFATMYGGGAYIIAQETGKTIDQARKFQETLFEKMPGIKNYIDRMRAITHSEKKVVDYWGRVRRLDAMYVPDWRVQREGEKEGINMPISASAAEVVKLAMIDLHYKHHAPLLLQVHDELMFELDSEKQAIEYAHWLKEYVPKLTEVNGIFFPVDVGVGKNWKEAKENHID